MLNEMAYPTSFDQNYFESLKSCRARIQYCRDRLPFIGVGSARSVYKVDDDKVIKVAKSKSKGLAQNEVEGDPYWQNYNLFARLISAHPKYYWVEMEYAKKAKESDFDRIIGKPHAFKELICPYIEYVRSLYDGTSSIYGYKATPEKKKEFETIEDSPDFEDTVFAAIQFFMTDTEITAIGDMKRLSSWGVVDRNGKETLVMIDYGYNDYVRDAYYIKSKK